jgi:flagellar biosynthesis/type III secretory pathway M-ring protein FliF/YscJ
VDALAALVVVVVLAIVVLAVSAPLRARGARLDTDAELRVAELEARKEAKYREIRDLELDFRTGKLSEADHRIMDRELRAEAMEVLRELDEALAAVARAEDPGSEAVP